MSHIVPFRNEVRGVGVTGGTVTIQHVYANPDEIIRYKRVTIENQTSNGTIVRIGIRTPFGLYVTHYLGAFNANLPQTFETEPIDVCDGDRLEIQLTGTTNGDVCVIWLYGDVLLLPKP